MTATAPVIGIGDRGSFAHSVFHDRHPTLVQRVADALPHPAEHRALLQELLHETLHAAISPPPADLPDRDLWLTRGRELWGRPWHEAPFLWAESYFYLRILHATGWFGPGAWQGVDPFGPFKSAELASPAVDEQLAALDTLASAEPLARRDAVLTSSLWGNRADLSFAMQSGTGSGAGSGTGSGAGVDGLVVDGLVVDEREAAWSLLEKATGGTVAVFLDNAGRELLPDLVLTDHLLTTDGAARVTLYVKPRPYFVSDATTTDVLATVDRLCAATGSAAETGSRLRSAIARGAVALRTHEFFCSPGSFHDLPADLRAEVAGAAVTVFKGDLNYRRLVGDRLWPPTTPFARVVEHFPTPVVCLRTCKSDVVTGLTPPVAAALEVDGGAWRSTGRFAMIQAWAGV